MTQVSAAVEKNKNTYSSHDDKVLDTTRMKGASATGSGKSSDITNVSDVAS